MFDCYDKIIGLSDSDCVCTQPGRPADYDTSKSGIYLDELSSIARLIGLAECDKTVWDILEKARSSAVKQFVADTNALLGKKYSLKRKAATSQIIGQIKHKDTYSPTKNYAVVPIVCAPVRGGIMRLHRLGATFTQTGTFDLQLYNNVDGLVETFTMSTVANKLTTTTIDKEYPLYSKYAQPLEYYLVYPFDAANLPKATHVHCGCGGWTPVFDKNNPYYLNIGQRKSAGWSDFVMVGGKEILSLTELESEVTGVGNSMFGISIDASFSCKVDEVICEGAMDFVGNPLALSAALAVQYAAGAYVARKVMKSAILNIENMVGLDDWEYDEMTWMEKYNEKVNYIVSQVDHTANDCLTCKDIHGLTRGGLFS